jgi:hypothetical protein
MTLEFRGHGPFVNFATTSIFRLITIVTTEVRLFHRHAQLSILQGDVTENPTFTAKVRLFHRHAQVQWI